MNNKMTRVSRTKKSAQRDDLIVEEEPTGFQVEGSDVAIGAILAVAIPAVVYILLAVSGMPVARQEGMNYEESAALRKELLQRADPPITAVEFDEQYQRAVDLVDRYVAQYRGAAAAEEEVSTHQYFLDAATTCLNRAHAELKQLELATANSPQLRSRVPEVQNRLNTVSRLQREVKGESKFKAVYDSQEARKNAEAMLEQQPPTK